MANTKYVLINKDDQLSVGRRRSEEYVFGGLMTSPLLENVHGITVLSDSKKRGELARIYLLSKGFTLEDIRSNTRSDELKRAGQEMEDFLCNIHALPDVEWRKRYIELFAPIYLNGSEELNTADDLGNDENLAENYEKLHIFNAMNVVGETFQQLIPNNDPVEQVMIRNILDAKKETYENARILYQAAETRANLIRSDARIGWREERFDLQDESNKFSISEQALAKAVLAEHGQFGIVSKDAVSYDLNEMYVQADAQFTAKVNEAERRTQPSQDRFDLLDVEPEDIYRETLNPERGLEATYRILEYSLDDSRVEDDVVQEMLENGILEEHHYEDPRKAPISNFLHRLKETDPWYHVNSREYKNLLSSLEEVDRLNQMESSQERDEKLQEAYESLNSACDTYLSDKTYNNRKSSLGKQRVTFIKAIKEVISPNPERDRETEMDGGIIQTDFRSLQNASQPSEREARRHLGAQRERRVSMDQSDPSL